MIKIEEYYDWTRSQNYISNEDPSRTQQGTSWIDNMKMSISNERGNHHLVEPDSGSGFR